MTIYGFSFSVRVEGHWELWGEWKTCPEGSFVTSFRSMAYNDPGISTDKMGLIGELNSSEQKT